MAKGKQADLAGLPKNQLVDTEPKASVTNSRGCKHGNTLHHVLTIGKAKVYAGAGSDFKREIAAGEPFALLICVGGPGVASSLLATNTEIGPAAARCLPRLTRKVGGDTIRNKMMVIDWPDFSAPPVGSQWWQLLYEDLSKVQGNVGIFCMGGHGRTGTALTILAWLNGDTGTEDPVVWVRNKYCDHAVESTSQMDYLNRLGIKTTASGYKMSSNSGSSSKKTSGWVSDSAPKKGKCGICNEKNGPYEELFGMPICDPCWATDAVKQQRKELQAKKSQSVLSIPADATVEIDVTKAGTNVDIDVSTEVEPPEAPEK